MKKRIFAILYFAILIANHMMIYASGHYDRERVLRYTHVDKSADTETINNIYSVISEGDTLAYKALVRQVPYYDYFVFSLYMANEYNYGPAYYNTYRIYDLWLKLYDASIDLESRQRIKFWLNWGEEAGNKACKLILSDVNLTEQEYKALDSINDFMFFLPQNITIDTISTMLIGSNLLISTPKKEFEEHKQKRIHFNQRESRDKLEQHAREDTKGYSLNENLLFRIHEQIKHEEYHKQITFSILWYLVDLYLVCERYDCLFSSKLGIYLLHSGFEANDEYSIIHLATLYAQGCGVPQNKDYAHEILTKKMSQETALKWINKWSRESPSCQCAK